MSCFCQWLLLRRGVGGETIGRSSTGACGSCARVRCGGIFLKVRPWKTCHERLRRQSADGTWDRILTHAQVYDDGTPVEWVVSVDSLVVRAHQHAAGVRKKGEPGQPPQVGVIVAACEGAALGCSQGGLSTKIRLAGWAWPPAVNPAHAWPGRWQPAAAQPARCHQCQHIGTGTAV